MNKIYVSICILMVLLASCSGGGSAGPIIIDIFLDPGDIVDPDTDVKLNAAVDGKNLTYKWTVEAGSLREGARSGQGKSLPKVGISEESGTTYSDFFDKWLITADSVSPSIRSNSASMSAYDVLVFEARSAVSVNPTDIFMRSWVEDGGTAIFIGSEIETLNYIWNDEVTIPEPDPYAGINSVGTNFLQGTYKERSARFSNGSTNFYADFYEDGWVPIIDVSQDLTVIAAMDASGYVETGGITNLPNDEDFSTMPVALRFEFGKGEVIYTNLSLVIPDGENYPVDESGFQFFAYLFNSGITHNIRMQSRELLDLGGYFNYAEVIGLTNSLAVGSTGFEAEDLQALNFVFNGYEGSYKFTLTDPEDREFTLEGSPPFSSSVPDPLSGSYAIKVEALDDPETATYPWCASIGVRITSLELVTTNPEIIWRSPVEPGLYNLALEVTDGAGKSATFIQGIRVE